MNVRPIVLELPGGVARLEPLCEAHAPGLLAACDAASWRYMPEAAPRTLAEMVAHVHRALSESNGTTQPFVIIHRPSSRCAGATRYLDISPANRGLEIGWTWLSPEFQRTAVNTECKYLLLRHAFEELGAIRVQLKTDARNERSQKAILRISAKYEGTLRKSRILHDGHQRDSAYFSVLDDEWLAVKRNLERRLGI